MPGRARNGGLVAALLALAACSSGTSAADRAAPAASAGTVSGVGALAVTEPTVPLPSRTTTTTIPLSLVTDPATSLADDPYVLAPGDQPTITDPRVMMVGDSVLEATTFGDPDPLDRYVAALGWRIWVDAYRGRHLDQGLEAMQRFAKQPPPWKPTDAGDTVDPDPVFPQVVVLMLGNNYEGDRAGFQKALDDTLQFLSRARKIVMFTVPLYKPMQQDVNDVLRAEARRDHRLVLVDWERMTRDVKDIIKSDHLHPNDLGAQYLAEEIGRVLGPAPGVPFEVDVPLLGQFSDAALPAWVPKKVLETTGPDVPPATSTPARPPRSTGPGTTSGSTTSPP